MKKRGKRMKIRYLIQIMQ